MDILGIWILFVVSLAYTVFDLLFFGLHAADYRTVISVLITVFSARALLQSEY
ncbi:MAG: hypothetical protein ACFCU4_09280 [Puniceicoccaceae bacterium]